MDRVREKVAFITGAGRGQGRAHAVRLAEEGAHIVATDICRTDVDAVPYGLATATDLEHTAELVRRTGQQCLTRVADVRDVGALEAAVSAGLAHFGRLDVVVANAGVISSGRAWELTEQAWDTVLDTNLKGVWNTVRATVPVLLDAGNGGSIVIISSAAGIRGHVAYAHYVASKHGTVGLMKALSNELAPHRIRVNSVHPTGVSGTGLALGQSVTELYGGNRLFGLNLMNTLVPQVSPRDVSHAVLFLASDEAEHVTGLEFTVDGGNTTKP